jgi:hypothetical protein
MNLLDAVVTKVLSGPTFETYNGVSWWEVKVEYECWGSKSETCLTFPTKEDAETVAVGYKFLT